MARTRIPDHLKVIRGTAEQRRMQGPPAIDIAPLSECPTAPDWLPNVHSLKEWNRLGPILAANKLLTDASVSTLGHLCALYGKIVQIWSAGETPPGTLVAQYRNLINDFGLTPVARGKIKFGAEPPKRNRFSKHKSPHE